MWGVFILVDSCNLGLLFALPSLGLAIALRCAMFPDLTTEGSFALGAAVAMVMARAGAPFLGVLFALPAGALMGLFTAGIFTVARTGKLISGIIGMVVAQSVALVVMGATVSVGREWTIFRGISRIDHALSTWLPRAGGPDLEITRLATISIVIGSVCMLVAYAGKSTPGLAIRSLGSHSDLLGQLGRRPSWDFAITLALANVLSAAGGALFANHQAGFDAALGVGTVVSALVALLLGEEVFRRCLGREDLSPGTHAAAVVVGSLLYMLLVSGVAEVVLLSGLAVQSPNLRRLATAVVLAGVLVIRRGSRLRTEDI